MIFKDLDRIVFAGDSITDAESVNPVGDGTLWNDIGLGFVRAIDNMLAAYYPELRIRITNSGVNGQTSTELLNRWQRDVLDLKPAYVNLLIGANDVWRQFDSPSQTDQQVEPDVFEANVRKMIELTLHHVKGMFIMSPYYMEPLRDDPMRHRMEEYAAICKKLAEEYSCEYIDIQSMFDRYFKYRHTSFISWDRIHPNKVGSQLMAREFLSHCGFDYAHIPE